MNSIITPQSEEREVARTAIRREVAERYEEEKKRSGLWWRLLLHLKIEREVRHELNRRFPPHALFLVR